MAVSLQGLRGESFDSFATFPRPSWESQDRWPLSCSEQRVEEKFRRGTRGILQVKRWEIHKAWVKKWPIFLNKESTTRNKVHIYTNYYSISVVRHGSWPNEPWMGEKHMKWNCEVKQRKLAKKTSKNNVIAMQSISSFLWILLSNDLHRQNIRQIPDREYLCFWEVAFLHVHWFWKLTLLQTSLQKNTTWDHTFLVTNKKTDAPFFVVTLNDGFLRQLSTIWLKSIDVSDRYSDGCFTFYSSHEISDQLIIEYFNPSKSNKI